MGWGGGLEEVPAAKRVGKDPNLAPLHRLGLVSRLGAATGGVASCPAEPSLRPSGYWASGSRSGAVPPPLPSKPPPGPNRASPAPEPAAAFPRRCSTRSSAASAAGNHPEQESAMARNRRGQL